MSEASAPQRAFVGRTVWHYDVVESTQDTAKELLDANMPQGLAVWADRQTSGRGRHGRAWASPPGGLYVSLVLEPKGPHAHVLGLLMGIPLVKALRHFGVLAGLKWPNDAVYQDRKIAGILSEGVYRHDVHYVVMGIGVNTNVDVERLPSGVRERATSLRREVSLFVANEEFLDFFLNQADQHYSRYRNTPTEILLKDYRGQCQSIGRRVAVETPTGRVVGLGFDIGPQGSLVVLDDRGTKHDIVDGTVEHVE
ncbi:MAG: biotin--[acetyl-CoA-carboxylase] ligase [Methanobacteriota archaeon]